MEKGMSEDKEVLKTSIVMNTELSEAGLSFQQITLSKYSLLVLTN